MSEIRKPRSTEHDAMLAEIGAVFRNLSRGGGVTLHESGVLDEYGDESARRQARLKDTDNRYWEVRDEWLEEFEGVGGLSFMDAAGFRYYLPAYMSYWLRNGRAPGCLTYHLQNEGRRDYEAIFSARERKVIARFLDYVRVHFQDRDAEEALAKVWGRYLADGGGK